MTLIPPDTKIPIRSIPDDTYSSESSEHLHGAPPPYTPTDPSITSEPPYVPLPHPTPSTTPGPSSPHSEFPREKTEIPSSQFQPKTPESGPVKSSSSVKLSGPLNVLGNVSSSASINLSHHVRVEGKTSSSGSTTLSDHVTVEGKVDASGSSTLR